MITFKRKTKPRIFLCDAALHLHAEEAIYLLKWFRAVQLM